MKPAAALACLLPCLALAQTNLKFQDGAPRQIPPGWFVLDAVQNSGYAAEWRPSDACRNRMPCAVLSAPANPAAQSFGTLMQSFDAAPYRGKLVRLRAWIRVDSKAPTDHAQMLLHVARPNSQEGFVDNMADRPISGGDWQYVEIRGEVAADAATIRLGLMLYGAGRAWIGEVEFGPVVEETSGAAVDAARTAIVRQYARMDAAFLRGDTKDIAAILAPDAQMRVGTIHEPLLPAIEAEINRGSKLATKTEVASVRLDGSEAIAVVRREATDTASDGTRSVITSHRDLWTQMPAGWQMSESVEVSFHWILPPTGPEVAHLAMAELVKHAVTVDQLAAFGAAVGEARVVALGEAAHETREFSALKQQLAEFLAKSKGFTTIAAAHEADVHELAARLHLQFAPFDGATPEQQANNLARVAAAQPQGKILLWTDNAHARDAALRTRFGRGLYVLGFAFHHGDIRAVGVEGGESRGLATYTVPPPPDGWGDAILQSAGMPQFFLNMSAVPSSSVLGRWLAGMHLFHDVGAYWILDDPQASLQPIELSKNYDGLFFIAELHSGV